MTKPTTRVLGSEPNSQRPNRKLDFGICRSPDNVSHWETYLVVGELKHDSAKSNTVSTWLSLASYAREIFAADGTRQRVFGFTLCNDSFRLWVFDRLGAIGSQSIEINTEEGAEEFLKALAFFVSAPDAEMGVDTSFSPEHGNKSTFDISYNSNETERVTLTKTIKNDICISGRATVIVEASLAKNDLEKQKSLPVILKHSWPYVDYDPEGEFLLKAEEANIDGVIRLHCQANFYADGKLLTVQETVRKRLNIRNGCEYNLNGISADSNHIAPASKTKLNDPAIKPFVAENETFPGDRYRQCLVLVDFGTPLVEAKSIKALLEVIKDCLEVHRNLFIKANILHRDINIGNILMTSASGPAEHFKSSATLIDLGHATLSQSVGKSGAIDRTGTKFRSIRLLRGSEYIHNTYEDDVESFFWILFWIAITYSGPEGKEAPVNQKYEKWNFMSDSELGGEKGKIVDCKEVFKTATEDFNEYFEPLSGVLSAMRDKLFPEEGIGKLMGRTLFDEVKRILEDGISKLTSRD